jgi:uncharacterized protein
MGNPFVHVELMSTEVGQIILWKTVRLAARRHADERNDLHDDQSRGRDRRRTDENPMPGAPSAWVPYVLVQDVRAATDKAKSLGAGLVKDVSEVPGMGSFSIITNPTGAMLGFWESKKA